MNCSPIPSCAAAVAEPSPDSLNRLFCVCAGLSRCAHAPVQAIQIACGLPAHLGSAHRRRRRPLPLPPPTGAVWSTPAAAAGAMAELATADLCDKHRQEPVDVMCDSHIQIVQPGLLRCEGRGGEHRVGLRWKGTAQRIC